MLALLRSICFLKVMHAIQASKQVIRCNIKGRKSIRKGLKQGM